MFARDAASRTVATIDHENTQDRSFTSVDLVAPTFSIVTIAAAAGEIPFHHRKPGRAPMANLPAGNAGRLRAGAGGAARNLKLWQAAWLSVVA